MSDLFSMLSALDNTASVREESGLIRAPFGWPGGKSRSLDKILPELPHRDGYGEAFGGSGAVLLARKECQLEVFNDRFSGVTCFYRCLRDPAKLRQILDRLQLTVHSREEWQWCYNTWENVEDEVERAARWWYSVACSFASQGRNFGRCIKGKSQIGQKLKNNLRFFEPCHHRLKHVQIENLDWRQVLKDYDGPDFVWYLDPPYYEYCKGMYKHEMTKEDHHEMLERIFQLDGFVALSGYDTPVYNKYPWDNKLEWQVSVTTLAMAFHEENNLAGKQDTLKRGKATECLWIKESR